MYAGSDYLIAACLFLGAVLYTSVGHAGASAYIAVLSLFGVSAAVIKPTALALNIAVASYTSFAYVRANLYERSLVIPLLAGAIPMAYVGGMIQLPGDVYKPLVGIVLLISAFRFIRDSESALTHPKPHSMPMAVVIGAVIGFLAGLTGTGGGIFLSPLILFLGWTTIKGASGTAALFILVNSVAGLLGNLQAVSKLPPTLPLFLICVLLGALIGTRYGIRHFSNAAIRRVLGLVILVASLKLIFNL